MAEQTFQALLQEKTASTEAVIKSYLPKEEGYQKTVLEAMNYSVIVGGKRLRPTMMQEVYRLFGGKGKMVEPFMAAIEMIHTYSLVHDDLPAMDNDEFRRGRKTTWKVYGEAMGILAGDALLNYAFETALKAFEMCAEKEDLESVAKALSVLAKKSGIYGMIGGQTADVEAETKEFVLSTEQLLFIHEHKTAALIQASMMIGAILAGADEAQVKAIEKCAYNIGVAFQIQDDVLDIIGDSEELGKPVGSDEQNNKQTYVTIHGLEHSRSEVDRLSKEAVEILSGLAREHVGVEQQTFLEQLILNLIHRTK